MLRLDGVLRRLALRLLIHYKPATLDPPLGLKKSKTSMDKTHFPIDLAAFKPLVLNPASPKLTDEQRAILKTNIQLCRDVIIFFTAVADAKGLGGHTGGPYDTVPEVMIGYSYLLTYAW